MEPKQENRSNKKMLETNIKRIKELSERNEEENWGFRSFLKFCDTPPHRIDAIVHRLYKKMAAKIDCTKCGNCCKEILPILDEDDISRMAEGLNLSVEEFKKKYVEVDEEKEFTFNARPCPLLEGTRCSVYETRPEVCRSYPHLHKKEFTCRLISVIGSLSICPIVFNVFNELKGELQVEEALDDFESIGSLEWEED